MDNLANLLELFIKSNKSENDNIKDIPTELKNQYPYGEFPIRYTKLGQEEIRKHSENRFLNADEDKVKTSQKSNNFDMSSMLPLLSLMSGGKKNSKDMFGILSKILFKDNPDMLKLFSAFNNIKGQEINSNSPFPDTNKIQINSLKRIN